jgi:hypothetical protein
MATRANPGDHHFIVLDCSINNTPVFVLAVVTYKKPPSKKTHHSAGRKTLRVCQSRSHEHLKSDASLRKLIRLVPLLKTLCPAYWITGYSVRPNEQHAFESQNFALNIKADLFYCQFADVKECNILIFLYHWFIACVAVLKT